MTGCETLHLGGRNPQEMSGTEKVRALRVPEQEP